MAKLLKQVQKAQPEKTAQVKKQPKKAFQKSTAAEVPVLSKNAAKKAKKRAFEPAAAAEPSDAEEQHLKKSKKLSPAAVEAALDSELPAKKAKKSKKPAVVPETEQAAEVEQLPKSKKRADVAPTADDESDKDIAEAEEEPTENAADEADVKSDESDDDDDENIAVDLKPAKNTKQGVSVFVGNLPNNIKRKQLIKLFAPFAKVQAVRFRRSDGGQLFNVKTSTLNSVIAFVDVPSEAEARAAADGLNGIDVRDHVLRVNLQRDAKNAGFMDEKRTICAGNLAYEVTDDLLRETFECCGEIEYVRTIQNAKGCSGIGFVCFAEAASVPMAFELNNGLLCNRPVRVSRYSAHKKPAEGKPSKRHQTFGAQRRLAKKTEGGAGKVKVASVIRQNIANDVANKKGGQRPADGKKTKREFVGAKVADKKNKGKKPNKKGGLKGPKLLAKKIAPRE